MRKLEPYSVLLVLLLCLAINPLNYPQELKVSLEEISQTSDIIFTGNVTNIISLYNKQGSLIFTEVTFNDIEVLHSSTKSVQQNSNVIKLKYTGGQIGDLNVEVSGMPKFFQGHKYLVFMLDDGRDYFNPIVGGNQGLFEILKDKNSDDIYLSTLSGKAIVGITSEGLVLSKNKISYIENGNAIYIYNTERLVDLQNKQIPVSDDPFSDFISYSEEQQNLNPLSLKSFTDYLSDHLLRVTVENRVLRLNRENNKTGTSEKKNIGLIQSPDYIFEEYDFSSKQLLKNNSTDKSNIKTSNSISESIEGGTLGACGYHNLSLVMEQVPESWWSFSVNDYSMWLWNKLMDVYRYSDDDGSYGGLPSNLENEFCGFVSDSDLYSVYGWHWGTGIAMCITYSLGDCRRILQSDIAWNSEYSWTNDANYAIGNPNVKLLQPINMHELGHSWGEQLGEYPETYDYDVPTVMHAYYTYLVENGKGIHSQDAYLFRRIYDDQTSIINIKDVGVESYYASNGLKNSTTNKVSFVPGETISIKNVTVENMSNSTVSDLRIRFYLSSDRTITTNDYQIGSYWYWSNFSAESYNVGTYNAVIPSTVPAGSYYVGALVIINGYGSDNFSANNTTTLFNKVTIIQTINISGYIRDNNNQALNGVTLSFSNGGGTTTTNSSGYYEKVLASGYSGIVTPSLTGWTFNPANISFNNITTNQINQNYTGIPGQFTLNNFNSFIGLAFSSSAWGDYDNDGDLDFIVAGQDVGGAARTNLYKNNGNSTFTQNTLTVFPGVVDCSVAWGDYDNDGELDLLITGWTGAESISRIYKNNGNRTFTFMSTIPLTGVRWGAIAWGDYDNDGDFDILLTGLAAGDVATAKIYRNNGNHTFIHMSSIQLTPVWGSSVAWGDYDNDGDLDILMNGYTGASGGISKIYKNNGNSTFTVMTTIQLVGTWEGSVKWIDYDSDGDLDILLMGTNGVTYYTRIYKNNGNGTFTFMSTVGFIGTREGSADCFDYDNDGDVDILISGLASGETPTTKIYRNNGNGTFNEMSTISLNQISNSSVSCGDYDNDGDLDLLITGNTNSAGTQRISYLYRNNCSVSNTVPSIPINLSTAINGNNITFNWSKSFDNHTDQNGLSYNLAIGTAPNLVNKLSPMSNRINGFRRIVNIGNTGQSNSWTIQGLDSGQTYYWSVQALDNCFAASGFAPEKTLIITSIEEEQLSVIPKEFQLSQNYPNPFNPNTIIKYSIPKSSQVSLKIFNTLGEEIETLVNEEKPAGTYELKWKAPNLPSGIYFYRLQAESFVQTRKMILLK